MKVYASEISRNNAAKMTASSPLKLETQTKTNKQRSI